MKAWSVRVSLFGTLEADQHKVCELKQSGTALCLSTFCLPDINACDRPLLPIFTYCKQSKTEAGEGQGTRLNLLIIAPDNRGRMVYSLKTAEYAHHMTYNM